MCCRSRRVATEYYGVGGDPLKVSEKGRWSLVGVCCCADRGPPGWWRTERLLVVVITWRCRLQVVDSGRI